MNVKLQCDRPLLKSSFVLFEPLPHVIPFLFIDLAGIVLGLGIGKYQQARLQYS